MPQNTPHRDKESPAIDKKPNLRSEASIFAACSLHSTDNVLFVHAELRCPLVTHETNRCCCIRVLTRNSNARTQRNSLHIQRVTAKQPQQHTNQLQRQRQCSFHTRPSKRRKPDRKTALLFHSQLHTQATHGSISD